MAILTKVGRAAIAESIKKREIHLAWGAGESDKKLDPNMTKLINEVGRRKATEVLYCIGDKDGDLIAPTGRYRKTNTPTNNLYLRFQFDFNDASNKAIREVGVMIGTVAKESIPPGKYYLEPKDIEDHGTLLLYEQITPIHRTPSSREMFTFVVSF